MKGLPYPRAALRVATVWLAIAGGALAYGCATPVLPVGTPGEQVATQPAQPTGTAVAGLAGTPVSTAAPAGATPTPAQATAQQLTAAICVCHVQSELGAPSVATLAQVAPATITQTARQGRGQMPAWSTQNLSDAWLSGIVNYVRSSGG